MTSHQIHHADWLACATSLPRASIDLIYADPPFNTGATKSTPPNAHRASRTAAATYQDSWPSIPHYIAWLRDRLEATLPALKPTANILLHVDWRTSHHVRIMLDDLPEPRQKLEAQQLWDEIKADGAQDAAAVKFDRLNEVIAEVRAEMASAGA